ncbi:MAG: hypothetical protein HND55_15400 [Pseudomonadota bacterium]|nr:MAG: hypothetical protein HND55_00070 [Pseudomonadota bacterium]QKK03916.1 MAG: hypothetical protein HND55_15400 [Pseudomonadota bacterium]
MTSPTSDDGPRLARRARLLSALPLLLLLSVTQPAQSSSLEMALRMHMAAPETVVRKADAIDLSPAHQTRLREIVRRSRADITDLELDLIAAQERLIETIRSGLSDEAAILEHFDRVLSLESRIKHRHFAMWLRVNQLLTDKQRQQLLEAVD